MPLRARAIILLPMSLRNRLLLAIAAAFFASFLAGTWITAWQSARLVHAELAAALETGRQGVAAMLEDIAGPPAPAALVRLVASFDDSRHLLAEWRQGGKLLAASHPAAAAVTPPGWFTRLASPGFRPIELAVAGSGAIRLSPLPGSEIGERWSEVRVLIALLGLFSALAGGSCFAVAVWGLRPLAMLAAGFEQLEHGETASRVAETGAAEIAVLGTAFNRMQQALQVAGRENRRLAAQLSRLAEEERAELARDLHDEVGPLLFAVTAMAAAVRMQTEAGDRAAASSSLLALEVAASDLQHTMRDLLRRLRDCAPTSTDLAASLEELMVFWRGIRPQTAFHLSMEGAPDNAPEPAKAALFRVAQEGVSNAVRHGNPTRVDIAVSPADGGVALSVQDDGAAGPPGEGFGLVGMEERLQALGGTLTIERAHGWRLTAWTPAERQEAA